MDQPQFLSRFPYVVVRIRCDECKRFGQYRLARLAERFGASASLDRVLFELTRSCPWRRQRPPRKYEPFCLAYMVDLRRPSPPDVPPGYSQSQRL